MKSKIQKILSIPKIILLKKFIKLPFKPINKLYIQILEKQIISNYLKNAHNNNPIYFDDGFDKFFNNETKPNLTEIQNIFDHKFDLLGSGLVKIAYDQNYPGFLGHNFSSPIKEENERIKLLPIEHRDFSQELILLIAKDYKPIDWFVDFRSGYRWKCNYYNQIEYGQIEGADIKVPWELARLHHIFDLCLAYEIVDNSWKQEILKEITNQILDFISMNPPFYGPNWVSPMEVSIRSVNLVFSLLRLRKSGVVLSEQIMSYVYNYLYSSFLFIKLHPEWNDGLRNNHYLANLLGMSVLHSFLFGENNKNFKKELYNKLKKELLVQFFDDGGNFEGSIPYHIFSFEILYSLIQNCQELTNKDEEIKHKLSKISEFNSILLKFKPEYIQIGDNDSGKIFKIRCLNNFYYNFTNLSNNIVNSFNTNILNNSNYKIFDNFGLVYLKESYFDLFFSLGRKAQLGKGGHNHRDSQSFIMICDNLPIFVDPGTLVYTASPHHRNIFRSSIYHNMLTDLSYKEFDDDKYSLFWLNDDISEYLFVEQNNQKILEIADNRIGNKRKYIIENNELRIIDLILQINKNSKLKASFHLHPDCNLKFISLNNLLITNKQVEITFSSSNILKVESYLYSPSYGTAINSQKISIELESISNFEISYIIKRIK